MQQHNYTENKRTPQYFFPNMVHVANPHELQKVEYSVLNPVPDFKSSLDRMHYMVREHNKRNPMVKDQIRGACLATLVNVVKKHANQKSKEFNFSNTYCDTKARANNVELSKMSVVSKRTIINHMNKLVRFGFIEKYCQGRTEEQNKGYFFRGSRADYDYQPHRFISYGITVVSIGDNEQADILPMVKNLLHNYDINKTILKVFNGNTEFVDSYKGVAGIRQHDNGPTGINTTCTPAMQAEFGETEGGGGTEVINISTVSDNKTTFSEPTTTQEKPKKQLVKWQYDLLINFWNFANAKIYKGWTYNPEYTQLVLRKIYQSVFNGFEIEGFDKKDYYRLYRFATKCITEVSFSSFVPPHPTSYFSAKNLIAGFNRKANNTFHNKQEIYKAKTLTMIEEAIRELNRKNNTQSYISIYKKHLVKIKKRGEYALRLYLEKVKANGLKTK